MDQVGMYQLVCELHVGISNEDNTFVNIAVHKIVETIKLYDHSQHGQASAPNLSSLLDFSRERSTRAKSQKLLKTESSLLLHSINHYKVSKSEGAFGYL
jgi:hypothetical protein